MKYIGNLSLIYKPTHGFLCSRSTKSNVILASLDWAADMARAEIPIMSTFHSKMEDSVLDILIAGRCPVILVLGRSIYKQLPEKLQPLYDAGRLLVISLSEQERISRESALICNEYICRMADDVTFGFISPDSPLSELRNEALQEKKNVYVLAQM